MILVTLLAASVLAWFVLRFRVMPALFRSPKVASNFTSGVHAWMVALLRHSDLTLYVTLTYMLYDTLRIALTSQGERVMTLHHAIVVLSLLLTMRHEERRDDMWRWLTTMEVSNLGIYFAYYWMQWQGRVPLWMLLLETAVYVYGRVWRGTLLMSSVYARYGAHYVTALAAAVWGLGIAWSGVLLRQSFVGVRGQFCMA